MRRSALALGGLLMPMQAASALLLPATRHIATSRGLSRSAPKTCRALSMGAAGAEGQEALDFGSTRLYPQPPLVAGGMLAVSELHTVAWYEYGNPAGRPALFVHGGPGGGTAPMNARYFDPALYRIILVDQRGCGKSTPFAELEENTTPDLVADFEQIRLLLAIDTWQVFGGSWGSTLALAYAVAHPERVTELVLRGVFLLRRKELDFFYEGKGTNFLFPEQWEDYKAAIPEGEHGDGFIQAYGKRLRGELGQEAQLAAAKAWSVWEGSVSRLNVPPRDALLAKWADADFALAFARIENHYFTGSNGVAGFFPRDGWLLEEENLARIRHIPTVIVQGRYDVVCPAVSAYELHSALGTSTLHMTTTGHSSFEPEIIQRLVDATDAYAAGGSTATAAPAPEGGWPLRGGSSGYHRMAGRLGTPAALAREAAAAAAAAAAALRIPPSAQEYASVLQQLMLSRRTINAFESELPVGWEASLQRAVRAATHAPNHKRTEPWRFHLLGPAAAARVCELNAELVAESKGAEAGAKKLKRWLAMPGWLVATCVRSSMRSAGSSMDEPTSILREDYAACCCAVQNLCLSLHAEGIGTKWTTGAVNFDPRFGAAAGLPEDEYVVGTLWFGEAAAQPDAPSKRLSMEEVLIRHD